MPQRSPLVVDTSGQMEQLPSGDFISLGKLNLGNAQVITVTSATITVTGSHLRVDANSNQTVTQINGGDDSDLLLIRGTPGMSRVRIRKGIGNIFGGNNRNINQASDILVLFKIGVNWFEVSWRG